MTLTAQLPGVHERLGRKLAAVPTDGNHVADPAGARARAWRSAGHAAVCDVVEPWAHGTVLRATHYPTYYDYNVVRVEDVPAIGAGELAAFADEALAGLNHRRLDFDVLSAGEAVRAELTVLGWRATRLLWMRHQRSPRPLTADAQGREGAPTVRLQEVRYDEVSELRTIWNLEDFGAARPEDHEHYLIAGKEVALSRDAQVLAVCEGGRPIAFAQLERVWGGAEVSQVYVHPDHRGHGLGTAVTRAAIAAAGEVPDLWITADDEDRPKRLYARLGFRPVWRSMEFLLLVG
jgi:ribosomal protein S18 acetylase RimI-like enzyme